MIKYILPLRNGDYRRCLAESYAPARVIGVITPWNLPLNQAARAIAPALVAGNVVEAKPSEITSRTTVEMARLASEVGFLKGVISVVLDTGREVGEAIVSHPEVRKVASTGSVGVGRAIGRIAADRIIPLTLELGGKSANIVFEDADIETAAVESVKGFTLDAGQASSAGPRILVQRPIYERFVAGQALEAVIPGETVGPIITPAQFQRVQGYFKVADLSGGDGFDIQPTIYADVDTAMRIAQAEIFGPVGVVIPFETEAEAIHIANDSDYGLIGTVWRRDISRALRVADRIDAGRIFVNVWNTMSVQTPFRGPRTPAAGGKRGSRRSTTLRT